MNKILKSRTFWTIVVMFLIGGFEAISGLIPDVFVTPALGILGILATYFKLNPSQEY